MRRGRTPALAPATPDDAEEVTHEVLVEVITRLGTCRGESAFRPWLYRSVADHVLTMREPAAEARG